MRNPFKQRRRKKQTARALKRLLQHTSQTQAIQFRESALNSTHSGVEKTLSTPIVVSLTTHSSRINDVYLTIESLFSQSRKADRIVLWVAGGEFSDADIPAILRRQCERGLEIRRVDRDLGPYTKFYYCLREFPDSLILTVDDDIMYPLDMIDQLYRAHLKQSGVIHCHRAHRIRLDNNGRLLPYKQWDFDTRDNTPSLAIFPTGVGGVLYFPGCFDADILNDDIFMSLAPGADDVWLKAMSLKQGTPCRTVSDQRDWSQRFLPIQGSQAVKLKTANKQRGNGNDAKIKAVFEHYNLVETLRKH